MACAKKLWGASLPGLEDSGISNGKGEEHDIGLLAEANRAAGNAAEFRYAGGQRVCSASVSGGAPRVCGGGLWATRGSRRRSAGGDSRADGGCSHPGAKAGRESHDALGSWRKRGGAERGGWKNCGGHFSFAGLAEVEGDAGRDRRRAFENG